MTRRRLVLMLGVALTGWFLFDSLGWQDAASSRWFGVLATCLLVIGLWSSTSGIDVESLREVRGIVLWAVTFGVAAKAALICSVMYLAFGDLRIAVLGVAVAQIDPLAVAAVLHVSRLSARGRALLAAWASFDDPVTAIATSFLSLGLLQQTGVVEGRQTWSDLVIVAAGVAASNLLAVLVGLGFWRALSRVRAGARRTVKVIEWGGLLLLGAFCVWRSAALAAAALGLFFRPGAARAVAIVTSAAYWCAVLALGGLLVRGTDLAAGLLLGIAAYGAQIVVGTVLARNESRADRVWLALAQQNGITAIILAIYLEATIGGAAGVIAPAIITVNLLHAVANRAVLVLPCLSSILRDPGGPDEPPVSTEGTHRSTSVAAPDLEVPFPPSTVRARH